MTASRGYWHTIARLNRWSKYGKLFKGWLHARLQHQLGLYFIYLPDIFLPNSFPMGSVEAFTWLTSPKTSEPSVRIWCEFWRLGIFTHWSWACQPIHRPFYEMLAVHFGWILGLHGIPFYREFESLDSDKTWRTVLLKCPSLDCVSWKTWFQKDVLPSFRARADILTFSIYIDSSDVDVESIKIRRDDCLLDTVNDRARGKKHMHEKYDSAVAA